jgi:ATP-dependent DNA ligase
MGCKIPGKAVERQRERGWMTFILFDLLRLGGVDFTKEDNQTRRSALELLYYRLENVDDRLAEFEYLQIADRFPLEQAEERFAEVVALGGEGIMLKNPLACYKPGTRPSKTWLKLKRKDTFDAVIMGFEAPSTWYAEPGMTGKDGIFYPEGRHTRFYMNGWIGAIIYGQYKDGQLVRMGRSSGINDEMREAMSNNQERYIGQVAEFACMGRNSKGASRHPAFKRMRPDKNASQCVFEEKALYDAWS